MSENTTDNKKFLGLKGLKLVLNNLKEKYSPLVHTHDDLYYTETEVDELLLDLKDGNTVVAKAEEATHATNADKATNADYSDEATHATNADNAINAENATKATQDANGNVITDTYETKEDATAKLAEAKEYANTAATTVKNDLLNGAGEAYDTLQELGTLIDENVDAIEALKIVATNKADKEHTHTVSEITDYVEPAQSDWNESDETALSFINNRTHYTETSTISETRTVSSSLLDADFAQLLLKNRQSAEYLSNDKSFVYEGDVSSDNVIGWSIVGEDGTRGVFITVTKNSADSVVEDRISVRGSVLQITVNVSEETVHQLDEKYIPNTITREGHVHSYNDLTDRTHYEEEKFGYLFEFDSDEGNTPPSNHNGSCTMVSDSGYRFINGETYTIETVDEYGVEISVDVVCNNFELIAYPVNSHGETMHIYKLYQTTNESSTHIYGEFDNWINSGGRSMLKLYGRLGYELKQLDEKYIPDSIARDNTFVITLINNDDGTYSYDKSYEEVITAFVDGKNLVCDVGMPMNSPLPTPRFLPFVGMFGGGFQFSACVDDNSTDQANPIPLMVGVTLCPGQYAETFQKDLFGTSVGLLDTTDKTIIGAINEVNEKVNNKADWNQNDETALDFIKNRTHYEVADLLISCEFTAIDGVENDYSYNCQSDKKDELAEILINSEYLFLEINGVNEKLISNSQDTGDGVVVQFNRESDGKKIFGFMADEYSNISYRNDYESMPVTFTANFYSNLELKQLDEKFIPDTIATKEYVDEHILSKEEVITLLTETGFISPATTTSGDIYTDSDGDIYVM